MSSSIRSIENNILNSLPALSTDDKNNKMLLALFSKVKTFEETKGFNTQGGAQHRLDLENLYDEVMKLAQTPSFRDGLGRLILSDIQRLYAMTYYPDFAKSRVLLLSSIDAILQLVKKNDGLDKKVYSSLKAWASEKLEPSKTQDADAIQERLLQVSPENMVSWTTGQPEIQWMLATAYRWLGHSLQNLPPYNAQNEGNNRRFATIYGTSRELLVVLKQQNLPQAKEEMVQLIYNSTLFMHMRVPGNTLESAWKEYEVKVIEANPENKIIEAMCYNLFSVQFGMAAESGKVSLAKALEFNEKCLKCYQSQPEKINPFHFANAHMNNAGTRIKMAMTGEKPLGLMDVLQISQYISIAQNHMNASRAQGNDHPYFVFWESHTARWLALNKNFEAAEKQANIVLERTQKPGCMLSVERAQELLAQIQALKAADANAAKVSK